MNKESIDKLVIESLAIEAEEAKAAGALGYMARALTQATMPHAPSAETEFVRRNGAFTLTMFARRDVGLPYGSVPRLLMAWLTTEAVRTKEPLLSLGPTLSSFMAELDLVPTGGRWGNITRLREQTRRLFSCAIAANYSDDSKDFGQNFFVADKYELWWSPKEPNQAALWQSNVTLNPTFFREVTTYPVPIDLRALKALKRSSAQALAARARYLLLADVSIELSQSGEGDSVAGIADAIRSRLPRRRPGVARLGVTSRNGFLRTLRFKVG